MTTSRRHPIRHATGLRRRQLRQYRSLKAVFLNEHVFCFKCSQWTPMDKRTLHHWAGRRFELLIWVPGFKMACVECHRYIESHRKWASEHGYRAPEAVFGRPSLIIPHE